MMELWVKSKPAQSEEIHMMLDIKKVEIQVLRSFLHRHVCP